MIIVCSGPDTYQSLERARELERAYREKYDPSGASVERLTRALSPQELASKLLNTGLFTRRMFVRVSYLFSSWKASDWAQAKSFFAKQEAEQASICVCVEEDLSEERERDICAWPKGMVYRYKLLAGQKWIQWCQQQAQKKQATWNTKLEAFAGRIEGDSWAFINALPRWMATNTLSETELENTSPFATVEAYLRKGVIFGDFFEQDEDGTGLCLQQARQALRCVDGVPDARTQPFVRSKWVRLSLQEQKQLRISANNISNTLVHIREGQQKASEWILTL